MNRVTVFVIACLIVACAFLGLAFYTDNATAVLGAIIGAGISILTALSAVWGYTRLTTD